MRCVDVRLDTLHVLVSLACRARTRSDARDAHVNGDVVEIIHIILDDKLVVASVNEPE